MPYVITIYRQGLAKGDHTSSEALNPDAPKPGHKMSQSPELTHRLKTQNAYLQ